MNIKNCHGLIMKIRKKNVICKRGKIRFSKSKKLIKWYEIALGEWLWINILTQLIYLGNN